MKTKTYSLYTFTKITYLYVNSMKENVKKKNVSTLILYRISKITTAQNIIDVRYINIINYCTHIICLYCRRFIIRIINSV